MKKKRGLGIGMVSCALITVAMVMGCVEHEEVPAAMPTPASVEPPTPPIAAERAMIKELLQLHEYADAEPPDDMIDEFMNEFQKLGVHPVTVFEGSLIF